MKNTLYRKLLYVISMVLLSLVAVLLFRPEEGIFRMHVIANSDSAADQATKLAVRTPYWITSAAWGMWAARRR